MEALFSAAFPGPPLRDAPGNQEGLTRLWLVECEQSFTDDAPLFPVFEQHILTLHSVMELHDSATLPYAAHMNLVT